MLLLIANDVNPHVEQARFLRERCILTDVPLVVHVLVALNVTLFSNAVVVVTIV